MYLNNSIFGGVGWGVGCSMGLLPPCDELYRDAPPVKGTFSFGGRGGGTPWHGLSGDVPLDRVSFSKISQQNHSNKPVSVE